MMNIKKATYDDIINVKGFVRSEYLRLRHEWLDEVRKRDKQELFKIRLEILKNKHKVIKICENCFKEFVAQRKRIKYCSRSCFSNSLRKIK